MRTSETVGLVNHRFRVNFTYHVRSQTLISWFKSTGAAGATDTWGVRGEFETAMGSCWGVRFSSERARGTDQVCGAPQKNFMYRYT